MEDLFVRQIIVKSKVLNHTFPINFDFENLKKTYSQSTKIAEKGIIIRRRQLTIKITKRLHIYLFVRRLTIFTFCRNFEHDHKLEIIRILKQILNVETLTLDTFTLINIHATLPPKHGNILISLISDRHLGIFAGKGFVIPSTNHLDYEIRLLGAAGVARVQRCGVITLCAKSFDILAGLVSLIESLIGLLLDEICGLVHDAPDQQDS